MCRCIDKELTLILRMDLFAGTVLANNTLFAGTFLFIFRFFLYCTARQHPAQNASTQRHGQPAPMDI